MKTAHSFPRFEQGMYGYPRLNKENNGSGEKYSNAAVITSEVIKSPGRTPRRYVQKIYPYTAGGRG